MKCILMNKDTEVLVAEYNETSQFFDYIYDVYDISHAPYILKSFYIENEINDTPFRRNLTEWFKGRGIPSWRDKLDILLHRLGVIAPNDLLDKAFGLSLSDQYWLKPYNTNIKYDDINFFDNDFPYTEFLQASLSKNSQTIVKESSLKTPNNTTDGMLKKAWIIENSTRYLLKGGYKNEAMQPFNEVLASEICRRLGFHHVEYTLDIYKDTVVSKCPCFITKDTELITCYQIRNDMIRHDSIEDYEDYIKVLEEHGLSNARIEMENMYILDFLIMNEDRHLNNFGVIRDVNTLTWVSMAPIFDNGQSLNLLYYDSDELPIYNEGRLFYETKSFDEIIKVVKDIKRIDVSKLDDIDKWFNNLLHEYQFITHFSEARINKLCLLLNGQIEKLKKLIES